MAKKIVLHTGFWHKDRINKLSIKSTLVMAYLLCNPKVSRTGIYTIYSEEIACGIGRKIMEAEEAREIIKDLENAGLIQYEHDADIVYILDFNKYCSFDSGRPDLVAKEILDDFNDLDRKNEMAMGFWSDYAKVNLKELESFNKKLIKCKYNTTGITMDPILNLISA